MEGVACWQALGLVNQWVGVSVYTVVLYPILNQAYPFISRHRHFFARLLPFAIPVFQNKSKSKFC